MLIFVHFLLHRVYLIEIINQCTSSMKKFFFFPCDSSLWCYIHSPNVIISQMIILMLSTSNIKFVGSLHDSSNSITSRLSLDTFFTH